MNYKLTVAYDGTNYLGWQKTKAGPTIEETLEKALAQVLQREISLQAASRTDAGVHAEGQVINFVAEQLDLKKLHKSLNSVLPKEISIATIEEADEAFHPTLDAKGKEYHYNLCMGPTQLPFHRATSWHIPLPLDLALMEQAAKLFVGEKDFSAFTNEPRDSNVRELHSITLIPSNNRLQIVVRGKSFLYKMVRNIVGTLVYVGLHKIALESLPHIFTKKDRVLAGVTAPAHGLTLKLVFY